MATTKTQGEETPLAETLRDAYKKALERIKSERQDKARKAIDEIREQITQAALDGRNSISFETHLYSQELQDWADENGFIINTDIVLSRRYRGKGTLHFEI